MEVSAIIPTHNRPDLLRRAIASVRSQTQPVREIVVVDDASSPPVSVEDDVVVVRFDESVGPAAARNAGAMSASGTHLAFLDDDDIWLDRKLERVAAAFGQYPLAGAVFHQLASCRGVPKPSNGMSLLEVPIARMLQPHPPHLSTLVVQREIHVDVQFDPGYEAAEDLDYNVRLAAATPMVEIYETLSCNHPREHGPTAINLDTRIRARQRFRAQHAELFTEERFERHHEMQLALLYRRAGRRREAMRRFAALARVSPGDAAAWKGLVGSLMPFDWVVHIGAAKQRADD